MKSEHLIHIEAKFEHMICIKRSLNVRSPELANVMQMKSEHLMHMKTKSEYLVQKTKSERLICCASKYDADEV